MPIKNISNLPINRAGFFCFCLYEFFIEHLFGKKAFKKIHQFITFFALSTRSQALKNTIKTAPDFDTRHPIKTYSFIY